MSQNHTTDEMDSKPSIVGLHYRVGKKIGEGSFGVIHEGMNVLDNKPIAIKFESKRSEALQLRDEYKSYKLLAGCMGIPSIYYYGQEGNFYCLVLDLLGKSLEDMFDFCARRFSTKTVSMLALQMISRVETIHEKNLIYRDIKPDNFIMGRIGDKRNIVHVVDFGMAKFYRDPKTKQHIPYKERKSLSGTARYMSINTHLGREQSRRDDLESLGNVFMYFLRGNLPWQGLKTATNKQKYEKIGEKKQEVSITELCEGYPEEFALYIYYVRNLDFTDTPNYNYLRGLFEQLLSKMNEKEDFVFDWVLLAKRREDDRYSLPEASQQLYYLNEPRKPIVNKDNLSRSQFVSASLGHSPYHDNYSYLLRSHPSYYQHTNGPGPSSTVRLQQNIPALSPYGRDYSNYAMYEQSSTRPYLSNSTSKNFGDGLISAHSEFQLNEIQNSSNLKYQLNNKDSALISSSPDDKLSKKKKKGWFKKYFCGCFL